LECMFKIYRECIPVKTDKKLEELRKEDPRVFIDEVCSYCLKAYRLRRGLVNVIKGQGSRVGVTL